MEQEKECRFGHICTSGCGNDFDCPCQSEHCCALTENCEGGEHCDDHYEEECPSCLSKVGHKCIVHSEKKTLQAEDIIFNNKNL